MKILNSDKMIPFGDSFYYIDLNEIEKQTTIKSTEKFVHSSAETTQIDPETGNPISITKTTTTGERVPEFDSTRFGLIQMMLDYILEYDEEMEESLGSERALDKASLSFKICFNTLITQGILKEI